MAKTNNKAANVAEKLSTQMLTKDENDLQRMKYKCKLLFGLCVCMGR